MKTGLFRQTFGYVVCGLVLIGGVLGTKASEAATYYVAQNGNDENPGTLAQPFRTLAKGVSAMSGGDTLYIRQGTYITANANDIPSGSSWTSATKIASYPGETATITPHPSGGQIFYFFGSGGSYIILDRLVLDGAGASGIGADGLKIDSPSHHIRFSNGEIKNFGGQGVLSGSSTGNEYINVKIHDGGGRSHLGPGYDHCMYLGDDNGLIENSKIYNCTGGYGLHFFGGTGKNWVIRNNRIHNNRNVGILLQDADNALVYNNVIYNNSAGIAIGGIGNKVFNNTVYNNGHPWGGGGIEVRNALNAVVGNNIVHYNESGQCKGASGGICIIGDSSGIVVRNNLATSNVDGNYADFGNSTVASGNLFGNQYDPKFINPTAGDFLLQPLSSAIDAGITLTQVPTDIEGTARPQGTRYDVGAYELQTGGSTILSAPRNLRVVQ
jgi:parallel beta-helix repeat protein